MDPSSTHQEMSCATLENTLMSPNKAEQEKKPEEAQQKCPRCDSSNTKFCYYNNYSLSQPRYFCKSCRRYWTKGGTLRNIPVGGGCRKNRKTTSVKKSGVQDLGFVTYQKQENGHLGFQQHNNNMSTEQSSAQSMLWLTRVFGDNVVGNHLEILDALRGGFDHQIEAPNGLFHPDLYYREIGHGMNYDQEMSSVPTTNNNSILWGSPWQINGDHVSTMGGFHDFDTSNKNGFGGCQGLLNSPLM